MKRSNWVSVCVACGMMWSLGAGCATDGLDPLNNGGDGDTGLRERDSSGGGGDSDVSNPDLGGVEDAGSGGEDTGSGGDASRCQSERN